MTRFSPFTPSLRGRVVRLWFKRRMSRVDPNRTVAQRRANLDLMGKKMAPVPAGITITPTQINAIHAEWLTPQGVTGQKTLLYLHGGGYTIGSCESHRGMVAYMAQAAGRRALVPEYRLAPEHVFPAGLEDAVSIYRWLLREGVEPEEIVIAGDSAGGGLTLATLLSLREAGDPLPAGAVLISPWTDLAGTGESMQTRAHIDPWFKPEFIVPAGKIYRGEKEATHPLVSPLYADLHGLPPMLVHVGDYEILLDDAVRLVEKMDAAGVSSTLKVWPGMWHVFQAFLRLVPEGHEAMREIGAFVRRVSA